MLLVIVIALALLWLAHYVVGLLWPYLVTTHIARTAEEMRADVRADNLNSLRQGWFR